MRSLDCVKRLRAEMVKTIAEADIPGIGKNVFNCRREDAWPEESAFAVVVSPNVQFDDRRTSPRFYFATADVYVDVYAADTVSGGPEAVTDFLDEASSAIVEALQPIERRVGPYAGLVKRFVLRSFQNNLSEKGETDRGAQRIIFQAEFAVCVTFGGPKDEFLLAKNSLRMGTDARTDFETKMRPNVDEDET